MKHKKCNKLMSEKGFALVAMIMVTAILMILGTALLTISTAEAKSSFGDENRLNAHYIALAGLDAVAELIIDNPSLAEGLIGTTKSGSVGEGSFSASVTGDPEASIKITSIGSIGTGINETITLELVNDTSEIFSNVVYSQTDLDFTGDLRKLSISGPLQSSGTIIPPETDMYGNPYEEAWPVIQCDPMTLPSFTIPSEAPFNTEKSLSADKIIDEEGYYGSISVNNGNLTFNIPDGEVFRVVVDNISAKGDVIINCLDASGNIVSDGDGVLHLYVKNNLNIQTPHTSGQINLVVFLGTPDPDDPYGPYIKGGTYTMKGNGNFSGYIYGPESTVIGNSSHISFEGAMVCKEFLMTDGDIEYYYIDTNLDLSSTLEPGFRKSLYGNK